MDKTVNAKRVMVVTIAEYPERFNNRHMLKKRAMG